MEMSVESLTKVCRRCGTEKELEKFHKQPTGPMGRHSWCSECANAYYRATRTKPATAAQRTKWNLNRRYRLSLTEFQAMRVRQGNLCAICEEPMARPKVDHDHVTGEVRGLLCHKCNLRLSGLEDREFRTRALAYLRLS